ncbi:hypothetical protein BGZ76_010805 [Entomortierella beljakovae]|nr:hypothetical protein BGZ76_010805 [Entomortierella beljakovae]
MALSSASSTSSTSSYPGLSNSLSSLLSASPCHIGSIPSSLPLSQTLSQSVSANDNSFDQNNDIQDTLKLLGDITDESDLSDQHTTKRESFFDYSCFLDALPQSSDQYQQPQQAQFQQYDDPFLDTEGWGTEHIQFLLGIADEKDCSEVSPTITESGAKNHDQKIPGTPVAEIKQPDAKEDFVHPGFYSIPKLDQGGSSTPNPLPLKMARKRSLQEEVSIYFSGDPASPFLCHGTKRTDNRQSPQPNVTELRRYSLDSHLSTINALSTSPHLWGVYSTPPKSPSTPSIGFQAQSNTMMEPQHFTEAPPGQPYMASFPSPNWMFGQEKVSPSLHHSRLARYQRTTTPKQSSSPFQPRKRRASKFKTDLLFPTLPAGGLQYPLNTVPPPLQQQHHQPYLPLQYTASSQQPLNHHQASALQHSLLHTPARETKNNSGRTQSYRRNPGEVPSSTLPPDHFVFQEALLGIGYNPQTGKPRSQSIPHVNSSTDSAKELTSAVVGQLENHQSPYQDKTPVSPPHTLPSTPESQALENHNPFSTKSLSMALNVAPQTTELSSHDGAVKLKSSDNHVLTDAAAFAQSLSTVSTLDPAATKLIDQLRLQEYLRTVGTSSTPSPSSVLATSIISCNSSIICPSPSSSPVLF